MRKTIKDTKEALEILAMCLYDDYRLGRYSIDDNDTSPMWHELNNNSKSSWLCRASVIWTTMASKNEDITEKKSTIYKKNRIKKKIKIKIKKKKSNRRK